MKTVQEKFSEIINDQKVLREDLALLTLSYFTSLMATLSGMEIEKIRNAETICNRIHPQHFYKNIRHSPEWRKCFRDHLKQHYVDALNQYKNALPKCSKTENPEKCKKLMNKQIEYVQKKLEKVRMPIL